MLIDRKHGMLHKSKIILEEEMIIFELNKIIRDVIWIIRNEKARILEVEMKLREGSSEITHGGRMLRDGAMNHPR
jgi:hypothetical protein